MAANKVKNTVTVGGKEYPCRFTMGAFRRFERETGRSYAEIRLESVEDASTLLWSAVKSACNADGVPFDMTADDFADMVSMDELNAWAKSLQDMDKDGSSKKKASA